MTISNVKLDKDKNQPHIVPRVNNLIRKIPTLMDGTP